MTILMPIFFLCISALLIGGGLKMAERTGRRSWLKDRESLSDQAIYHQFYASSGLVPQAVQQAWHFVADTLHCEPGRLRPHDSLADLAGLPRWMGSLPDHSDLDALEWEVHRRQMRAKVDGPGRMDTVDDVVRCLIALSD